MTLKKRPAGLGNTDITTVPPVEGNVLKYTNGMWRPSPSTGSSYVIELSRWGITEGLPSKRIENIGGVDVNCYSDSDYAKAKANVLGMTAAIKWAGNNGYTEVVMPFGSYAICHSKLNRVDSDNSIVISSSNMIIDFNKSTFKVIFDSGKRSPYHKMTLDNGATWVTSTDEPFWMGGISIVIRDCSFTQLKNGILIGDKIDRDFTAQKEKANEWSVGIAAGGNCKYINISNMDVSFYMGDAISTSVGSNAFVKTSYDMAWALGKIDATGAVVTSTTHCVSGFVPVAAKTPHFLHGYGNTQGMTELKNRRYTAYMYDANKVYITSRTQFVLRDFTTTKSTAFVRLVVEESSLDPFIQGSSTGGWEMILKTGFYGNYLTYENNYIHHNHRGGLTPGVNDMFIINNWFYNNGEEYDYENNLPGFEQENGQTYLTRYHINMEDTQGFNQQIIGNKFDNGRISIAIRCYDVTMRDNIFKNNIAIIYRVQHAIIKDNHFDNAGFDTYPYATAYNAYQDYIRNWRVEGNLFEGDFKISGAALVQSISNNTFTGMMSLDCPVSIFKNNAFRVDKDVNFTDVLTLKTVPYMEGCSFVKKDQSAVLNSIYIEGAVLNNCTFKNLKVKVKNLILKDSIITDSGFDIADGELKMDNCKINSGTYSLKNNYMINPENSAVVNVAHNTNSILVEIKNSSIVSSNAHAIFGSASNVQTNAKLKLDNTKITRQVNNKLGIGIFGNVLDFTNSVITSDVAATAITPNAAHIHKFVDCTFTNVSFNTKPTDIKYTQQDVLKTTNFGESGGALTYKGSLVAGTNATAIDRQTLNLYNKALLVTGTHHDNTNGNVVAGGYETHKIPVKPGYNYVFNKGDGISMQYSFYDVNDVYITGASNSRAKAPANARGLYVYIPSIAVSDALMVMETTNIFADYVPNTQKYLSTQPVQGWYRSKWFEKTWWVLGDSISTGLGDGAGASNVYANKPYAYLLGRDRSIKIQNEAVSGYTIANIYNNKVVNMPPTSDAPDLITIMAGTNDHGFNITIGAITDDPASGTSFYAVYRKTIEYLITQYPNASIGLITPIQRFGTVDGNVNNAVSKKLRDYCDAVVALGKFYSIPVLDWYDNLGFSPYIASQKTNYYTGTPSDGTHPNDLGQIKMAAAVGNFIERL
jgi:lysophospholipase L1-like esterase